MSDQRRGKFHVGWLWFSNKGHNACRQCAALHGKKFYFRPRPGQLSVEEMPQPPLHPNCRCIKKEILDYTYLDDEWGAGEPYAQDTGGRPAQDSSEEQEPARGGRPFESHGISDRFHRGAVKIFGVHWGSDGRSITDGPNYGNHGGQNWGSGRNTEGMSPKELRKWIRENEGKVEPIDKMDTYFKEHDSAYDKCRYKPDPEQCRIIEADEVLVRNLKDLPEDPNAKEWESKGRKNPEEVAIAKRYRSYAIWIFEGKSFRYHSEKAEGDLHGDATE